MNFKLILIFTTLLVPMAFAQTKVRKLAQSDEALNEIVLFYGSTVKNFSDIKLRISPFGSYLSFTSYGNQEYVLDCQKMPNGTWDCFSPCEGGSLKLSFSRETGFKDLTIAPFNIRPRLCDGSESAEDPLLNSRKDLKLKLEKIM